MKIKKFDKFYILRIQKDEEIITSLEKVVKNRKIKGAFFFGLGVGSNLILGYYNGHKRSYVKKVFEGEYEFTGFSGNISTFRNKTIVHCHITITDDNFNAFGGHLFQGVVPATLEILLLPLTKGLRRKKDVPTGLKLLDL